MGEKIDKLLNENMAHESSCLKCAESRSEWLKFIIEFATIVTFSEYIISLLLTTPIWFK